MSEDDRRQAFRHYQTAIVAALIRNGNWGMTPDESNGSFRPFNMTEVMERGRYYARILVAQEDAFVSERAEDRT